MEPTLSGALREIFGGAPPTGPSGKGKGGKTTVPAQARADLAQAYLEFKAAKAALAHGDLGAYQKDVTSAGKFLAEANAIVNAKPTTSTTTTTVPGGRSHSHVAVSSAA
jgi:molybdopterin-guanine dinucleotide biosynthesis protein